MGRPFAVAAKTDDDRPAWLWQFVVADWPATNAEDAAAESVLAATYKSAEFAREVRAAGRRSAAVSRYASEQGMTRKELRALVTEHHPDATPYPVHPALPTKRSPT